jgi:limonene-1,2-epoxide hydrolase
MLTGHNRAVHFREGDAMTPEEVVRSELDAWHSLDIEAIMSFLTDDIIWENVPIGADSGYDEVRKVSEAALGRMTSFQGEILNVAVAGDVVLTERIDHMNWDGREVHLRIMGAHELSGDKIRCWRDYCADMGSMGGSTG